MKHVHKPDYKKLRKAEYKVNSIDLLDAIADTIERLEEQGLVLPDTMTAALATRQTTKNKFKKKK